MSEENTGTILTDSNPHPVLTEMLERYRSCKICGGTGSVDGKMCDCLRKYRWVLKGMQARVPEAKLRKFALHDFIEKEVSEYNFRTNRLNTKKKLYQSFLNPYLSDLKSAILNSRSMLFLGINDSGKTMAMSWLLTEIACRGYSAQFVRFDLFLRSFWKLNDEDFIEESSNLAFESEFLGVDELGKQRTKEGVVSALETLLKEREERCRPTFLASNKSVEEFRRDYGASIFSLLKENFILLEFSPKTSYREESRKQWQPKDGLDTNQS